MSTAATQEAASKWSLPTKPSRLIRVPSPPESQATQPVVYHPYPHSTKRSNSANIERPSISQQLQRAVLKRQDSKISLSGKGVSNGRRTIAEQRSSSIITLQEEESFEEEEADSDGSQGDGDGMGESVAGGTADEEDYEESELENDDEEEQEISDFDSSGEYDEDEEEEDDKEEDDRITTGCTRSTSLSDSDDPGIRNWKSSSRGNNKGSRNDQYNKKCDSAKRYGIAVLIDDPTDLSNRHGFSSAGSAGGNRTGGGDFFDSASMSGLKMKPSIVPSLFDDGDAVLYFPKEGEAVTTVPSELKEAMKWKICKFTPRVVRTCLRRAGFKYIQNPYLIDKKKFDIRLYVVVTSFDPLRIYLYKEGIVRFAGENYSTNSSKSSIRNRYIHLTNYSVSKKKKKNDANKNTASAYPFGDPIFSTASSKWSLETLSEYFSRQGIKFDETMEKIKHVIVSTIISGHAINSSGTRMYASSVNSCYELFGFDVLLDANLKPWVMEVNISPSLKSSCDMDLGIKSRLSVDLFNLVGIRVKDLDMSQKKRKK
ncbi:UNVERIFIED_CONTAM: Tubulin polyglutamylase ttll4 [Siphonaria sp. JEL0065]|nr:Tubulin polyglutamylase ttll4 [Siphonaria sp. JEL0065]